MSSLPLYDSPNLNQMLMWLATNYFVPYYRSQSGFHKNLEAPYLSANFYNNNKTMTLQVPSLPIDNRTSTFNIEVPEEPIVNQNSICQTEEEVQHSPIKTDINCFESFADLVNKSSTFWMNKLNEQVTLNTSTEEIEEVTDKDSKIFIKEKDQFNNDNIQRISGRQIKKAPKSGKGKWIRKNDSRLLSLVKELGQDWIEIAGTFEEPFATPKYLEDRYHIICHKEPGLHPQKLIEEDSLDMTKSSGFYGENWDTMTDFLPSTQGSEAINEFYMMIKDDIHETSQSCFEISPEKSQEEIIDSYFNKSDSEGLEQTLLKNKDFLEKVNLCEDSQEAKERINLFTSSAKQPEEDGIGERLWEEKPKEEVVEILNGRISLIQSLYNQTLIELMKLQSEARNDKNIV